MRFILGGADTEMIEIATVLATTNHSVEYAKIDGVRVNRSEAYEATHPKPKAFDVWVECKPAQYDKVELYSLGIDLVDHHQEGDIGYDMPASKYWEASSLGQICIKLGIVATDRLRYIAAADHCLLAAYHEQCPDVGRDDFIKFRMAFFYRYSKDPFEYLKNLHKNALTCPTVVIGDAELYDISSLLDKDRAWVSDMACCFNMKTLSIRQKKNRFKLFVSNLSSRDIKAFQETYAPSLGEVITCYGDPKRQFAGAVIEGQYVS